MKNKGKERISVVVPTLNEARILRHTLSALGLTGDEELIVSDGGSTDGTPEIAREFTDTVLTGPPGRAGQMNLGAGSATGQILLFLHADCRLPGGAFDMARETLGDPSVSACALELGIDHPALRFRLIELGANLRSRLTRVPYGDQGLFVRRDDFQSIGGFRDMPLMEDVEIAGRLKRRGKIVFLRPPIKAAPRRWLKEGALHTTLRDWRLALSYGVLGADPEKLARRYRDVR